MKYFAEHDSFPIFGHLMVTICINNL